MTSLLQPANNKFLLQAGHDYLHQETMEWLSDLEFYKTELTFLSKLLDKAFLKVRGIKKLSELNILELKVKSFRIMKVNNLFEKLTTHERHLSSLDENKISKIDESIPEMHNEIKMEVKNFMDSIRNLKKEIFNVVEAQIRLKKRIVKEFEEGSLVL